MGKPKVYGMQRQFVPNAKVDVRRKGKADLNGRDTGGKRIKKIREKE